MYRALYRKWRPLNFSDVVGQTPIKTALRNQIANGHIGHAYLFTGVRGTGKTSCAKIFAKAVNCLSPINGDPCGECEICQGVENGTVMDIIEMDAASNNGVDYIRELRDETAYTPSLCKYKVYIIDEVHMLSTAAFNALLKTLEEPPSHVIFILATTEIQKVLATILSRCQRYDFMRITAEDLASRAMYVAQQEGLELTQGGADLIARLADGAARDTLSILDTCAGVSNVIDEDVVRRMAGVTDKNYLFAISDAILNKDVVTALAQLAELRQQSVDFKRLAEELIQHYRNFMLVSVPDGASLLSAVSPDEEQQYRAKSRDFSQPQCVRALRALGNALEKMSRGSDPRMEVELALLSLTQETSVTNSYSSPQPQLQKPQTAQPFAASVAPVVQEQVQPYLPPMGAPVTKASVEVEQPTEQVHEMPVVQVADEEKTVQQAPPQTQTNAPSEQKPRKKTEPVIFEQWAQILDVLDKKDPMLFGYVKRSKAYYNGVHVLIDGGNMFRDFIRANKESQALIKKIIFEVTGIQCGIGPYTVQKEEVHKQSAEDVLLALGEKGLNITIQDTEE